MTRLYYTNSDKTITCVVCEHKFNYPDIKDHLIKVHPNECYSCVFCKILIANEYDLGKHLSICRKKYHNDPNYFKNNII